MRHPIRVAQILGKMNSGGIESVLMNYYYAIDKSKVQFDFFFDETSVFPQRSELEKLGTRFFLLPPYSKMGRYQKQLKQYLRENNYKIVHSHVGTMSVFPLFAAWRAHVPIRICHNHSTASWAEPTKTLLKYILRPFNRLFATDYFACGEKAGKWMYGSKNFRHNKVFIMPNAINTQKFVYDDGARKKIREEFSISDKDFVVGHVGRFSVQKNHTFLIDIFNLLHKKNENSILLLVGEGELENKIREKVRRLHLEKNVIFAGVRADVNSLYNAMDVFCLPSNYEGFPVVIIETLLNGLPAVCSNKITSEIAEFGNVSTLPLHEKKLQQWVNAIVDCRRMEGTLHFAGTEKFDIAEQASRLCAWYEGEVIRMLSLR